MSLAPSLFVDAWTTEPVATLLRNVIRDRAGNASSHHHRPKRIGAAQRLKLDGNRKNTLHYVRATAQAARGC